MRYSIPTDGARDGRLRVVLGGTGSGSAPRRFRSSPTTDRFRGRLALRRLSDEAAHEKRTDSCA